MNSKKNLSLDSLSQDEQKLFNIYLNEYNDIFQMILLMPPNEFIHNIIKRVQITLKKKFNDININIRTKIEEFLTEQIYSKEYKYATLALKSIEKKINNNLQPKIFEGEIIEHCNKDKKNGIYIHTCGEPFYLFKYHQNNNENNNNNNENKNSLLICVKCEKVYKSNLIKFKCNSTGHEFYSKILNKENKNDLPFATWKKYHCNAVINDTMKCPNCNESLFYNKNENILICKKCVQNFFPDKISWICLICKKNFFSEPKEYNNLEFKNMKICVKDTFIDKIKAKPEVMKCNCEIDINKTKFFHKKTCNGELFLGEMDNKKIIVCNKCDSLSFYDTFNWTCPVCGIKFKIKDKKDFNQDLNKTKDLNSSLMFSNAKDKESIFISSAIKHINKNFLVNENLIKALSKDKNFHKNDENKNKAPFKILNESENLNKNILNNNNKLAVISAYDNKKQKNNSSKKINVIPTPNKIVPQITQSSTNLRKLNFGSRSPFALLRQNLSKKFSNIDLDDSIKNLGNVFSKCNNSVEKIYDKKEILNKSKEKNLKKCCINNNILNINSKNSISTATGSEREEENPPKIIRRNSASKKINIEYSKSNLNEIELIPSNNNNKINNIKSFDVNDFVIINQIGEGSFGKIFKVKSRDNKSFALKKIVASTKKDIENLQHEYDILLDVGKCEKKVNLINIYGIQTKQLDQTTYAMYVLMDLAQTDWEKEILLRKKKQLFYTENELMNITKDLIKTFAQLQRMNISHRDIKPQNILVFNEKHGYKLADFGEAKELLSNGIVTNKQTLRGTELYMSPILFHALRSKQYLKYINHNTYKSDVYSFGYCILFAAALCYEVLYDVRELTNNYSTRVVIEKYLKRFYSNKLIDLISIMLDYDEKTRCDFIELEKIVENLN